MNIETVLATGGVVALLVGIFGGGVEAANVKIPPIPGRLRGVSALTGIILIVIAIFLSKPELLLVVLPTQQQTTQFTQQVTPNQQTAPTTEPTSTFELTSIPPSPATIRRSPEQAVSLLSAKS